VNTREIEKIGEQVRRFYPSTRIEMNVPRRQVTIRLPLWTVIEFRYEPHPQGRILIAGYAWGLVLSGVVFFATAIVFSMMQIFPALVARVVGIPVLMFVILFARYALYAWEIRNRLERVNPQTTSLQ
jgi:hypothetical protein